MEKKIAQTNNGELDQSLVLPLHSKEVDLILKIRNKYRFGEITIKVRDGIPQGLQKVIVTEVFGIF